MDAAASVSREEAGLMPKLFAPDEREAFVALALAIGVDQAREKLGYPGYTQSYMWMREHKERSEAEPEDSFADHALIKQAIEAAEADPPSEQDFDDARALIADEVARLMGAFRDFEESGRRSPIETFESQPSHRALPDLRLLGSARGRRLLTRHDPWLFARLYLPDHLLLSGDEEPTFSSFHLTLIEELSQWAWPDSRRMIGPRDIYIAPRFSGKSTWLFLIGPLWAGAHDHLRFVAAFADTEIQATEHLRTLRNELDANRALAEDFPALCRVARRTQDARKMPDRANQIRQSNGFVMTARGIESGVLGVKIGKQRPDLLLLDDVEPHNDYSIAQMDKRLRTIEDAILPTNSSARAVMVGTTVMAGSLIHQAVKSAKSAETPEWIEGGGWRVSYWPAIVEGDDGVERSLWREKWSIAELQAQRHLRSFQQTFMNDPTTGIGALWRSELIVVEDPGEFGRTVMAIDPAVTASVKSDYTAIVVASRAADNDVSKPVYVREAKHVKLKGPELRKVIRGVILAFDHAIRLLVIESNQGGDLWAEAIGWDELHAEFPEIEFRTKRESEKKDLRAARAEERYGRGLVRHVKAFPALEEEMLAFPDHLNDDLVDALASALSELPIKQELAVITTWADRTFPRVAP